MSEIITSTVNPKIKHLIRLKEKRTRERDGVVLVEGRPEIDRYLETGFKLKEVYYCRELMKEQTILNELDDAVKKHEVSHTVYSKLAYGHRMEGLLAVGEKPVVTLKDIPESKQRLFVVIEHVEKPGNLGAILRSCDGVGADAVLVCDEKVDIYNPNVIRASLGTVFSRCVVSLTNDEALDFLRKNKISICATTPDATLDYTQADLTSNICLVMGAEDKGLTSFWLDQADQKVRIPMLGRADSLNVSVSTAVILYEILRQRQ